MSRVAGAAAVTLLLVGIALGLSRPDSPALAPLSPVLTSNSGVSLASASTFDHVPVPTPYFASFRGVRLRMPVPPESVTVFAYHQASPTGPLPIGSLVPKKNQAEAEHLAGRVRTLRAAKKPRASQVATPSPATPATQTISYRNADDVWTGKALELWRSGRVGKPNNAIDCGARPGTPVFSPVDGTVMEIRPYKLYGKYNDFEIHIKPDMWSDVDVVLLHTTNPCVVPGRHVIAGLDQISHVRGLAGMVPGLQLAEYTMEGGDHTHLQINPILKPGRVWVVGQDPPGTVRNR